MLDVVVLFSPRTARTFVGLMKQSEMLGVFSRLVVVCLSEAVAAELGKFTGDRVLTATEPTLSRCSKCSGTLKLRSGKWLTTARRMARPSIRQTRKKSFVYLAVSVRCREVGCSCNNGPGWKNRGIFQKIGMKR